MRDTRLVQTAVIGDEHSDMPVVLPQAAIDLDQFRHVHEHDTYWCGLLLGGCGSELTTKRYLDRQCHFSHVPLPGGVPHDCRRPAVGEASADHLYVKSAMSQSLLEHGRAARFAFPPPIGSLVDVDLEDGTSLRVHMDNAVPPNWTGGRAVVLGPGVVLEPGILAGCPYVHRVRCESHGTGRQVWIGTQSLGHTTNWVPLSDCTWTSDGLLTPAAAQILRERPAAGTESPDTLSGSPARSHPLPDSVATLIRGLEAAQRTGSVEHVRRLCAGSISFLAHLEASAREEAEQALEQARTWLAGHEDYQRRIFAELAQAVAQKRAWDVRLALQQASALTRRGASPAEQRVLSAARGFLRDHDRPSQIAPVRPTPVRKRARARPGRKQAAKARETAAGEVRALLGQLRRQGNAMSRSDLRSVTVTLSKAAAAAGDKIGPSERAAIDKWTRRTRQPAGPGPATAPAARRTGAAGSPQKRQAGAGDSDLERLAAAVRTILQKAASQRRTLTWSQVRSQLPAGLPPLARTDQTAVLIQVDRGRTTRDTRAGLLSALVTGEDHDMHPAYPGVAAALGQPVPGGRLEALAQWAVEVSRIQQGNAK
ncbi:hypothetical protein ACH4PR_41985 [Streptomyces mirabilis]|uniref:hypothetical protein n=1 Tax=Streptomyces mirabilis TaxID=68239 RepID=UPI003792A9DC